MKLYLARHATVPGAQGLCYGSSDWPADPAASQTAAAHLAAQLPAGVALAASPLQRCQQLAQHLAALRPDLPPPRTDARLAEMDFGAWEGRAWHAIGQPAIDAWLTDFAHARPGGGESVQHFMQRVAAVWHGWRANGQSAVWITHAGVIRAASLLHQGTPCPTQASQWPRASIGFGSLTVLAWPPAEGK